MKKILLFLILIIATTVLSAQNNNMPEGKIIAFTSDTQAPLWIETVFLKDRQNKKATSLVFKEINRIQPLALFILGDVVNLGYSDQAWKNADIYLKELRSNGIPVYATLGNHELMQRSAKGEANFQKRFPEHNRTGYVETVDSIAVIMLNSNFGTLSPSEKKFQSKWLKDTLEQLDSNLQIKFIILGCHHPPYTNSKLVKSSRDVQEQFVVPFLKSKKAKLFITGHSHAFEYFKESGKDFLIIGGGGGLHHPLKTGEGSLKDESMEYKPMFHFLTVKINKDGVEVQSNQLKDDFSGFEKGFKLNISY